MRLLVDRNAADILAVDQHSLSFHTVDEPPPFVPPMTVRHAPVGESIGSVRGGSSPRFARTARARRLVIRTIVFTTTTAGLLVLLGRIDPLPQGLAGSFYPNTTWSSAATVSTIDPQPSTARIDDAWNGTPPPAFSATWTGSLLALRAGRYVFATISDDASRVYVDGALVVDNGGQHGPQKAASEKTLSRGVHSIFVDYIQDGGGYHLDLLWGPDSTALEAIPSWAMTPGHPGFWGLAASAAVRRFIAVAEWAWILSIVAGLLVIAWGAAEAGQRWLSAEGVWPAMGWILAGSFVLDAAGMWWGVPGGTWAGDELLPSQILGAASRHFSHGWFDPYPPLHFQILTAAFAPTWILAVLGRIDLLTASTIFFLTARSVTVVMSAVTIAAVFACGARAFGRRAGLCGAAAFALVAPFVYYAKTANMEGPYLCWIALALAFYVRALTDLRLSDFVWFGVFATLATCTKDQAAGLFMLPVVVILWQLWRAHVKAAVAERPGVIDKRVEPGNRRVVALRQAVSDRRLWLAALAALAVYAVCQNFLFNFNGFVAHVRFITTSGISGYAMFPATVGGRLRLLAFSADLIRRSFGWPMLLIACAGVVGASVRPEHRRQVVWLGAPAVSYYLTFVNVIRYNYDRFTLPICLVMALFGGFALDRFLADRGRTRRWRIAAVGAVFAYSVLYAATVDVLMIRDSRYAAQAWLDAHVGPDELIAFTYAPQYSPRYTFHHAAEVSSIAALERDKPLYYVLDADYARSERPERDVGKLIAGLQSGALGYRLVYRYRTPSPWPWLPGANEDLVGPRLSTVVASSLRHINPTLEIFKREG